MCATIDGALTSWGVVVLRDVVTGTPVSMAAVAALCEVSVNPMESAVVAPPRRRWDE